MSEIIEFFEVIFFSFFKVLSTVIELIPTFIELKNAPINAIALAIGVPTFVVIVFIMLFKKISRYLN